MRRGGLNGGKSGSPWMPPIPRQFRYFGVREKVSNHSMITIRYDILASTCFLIACVPIYLLEIYLTLASVLIHIEHRASPLHQVVLLSRGASCMFKGMYLFPKLIDTGNYLTSRACN